MSEDELKKRFVSEATYQATIFHPNVVRVFDSNLDRSPPYFLMELAEATLAQDLSEDHTLSGKPQNALFDILAGLEGLHDHGIYHRDLKPQNILRIKNDDQTFRYAISDFGLIKVANTAATTLTATGAQGGTERYAAPELMTNFKRATARSDIFSFGVILQDIFAGPINRLPYSEVHFGGRIGEVASKCTKSVPARRYASISELRAALYEALQNEVPKFGSHKEQEYVSLLRSESAISEQQWDNIFLFIEEQPNNYKSLDQILRAFSNNHLEELSKSSPDLLAAYTEYYVEFVNSGRGKFDFDYCDVLADRLSLLYRLGNVSAKAVILIAMLGLGASHNRWFVERKFVELAGPALEVQVAERLIMEVEVQGLNILHDIEHIERSINANRAQLSPLLARIWEEDN